KYGRPSDKDAEIDASAKLPDGTAIDGVNGLRDALLEKSDAFLACLARKMGTYALGRELTRSDQSMIDASVASMKRNGHTLRSLIESLVTSPQFFSK
ncbi:MAG: DUF1585 domain-containing protein, partial [Verrucomicrobiae bacterium]|nr:DUF1585 domain-containing protein [Verrucomicrobiae bacterium]